MNKKIDFEVTWYLIKYFFIIFVISAALSLLILYLGGVFDKDTEENKTVNSKIFEIVEIDNNTYNLVNNNSVFKISSDNIEANLIKINKEKYCYILYNDSVLIFINDSWYQYVLQ